ncbi:hypothetical protein AN1V17_11610 [Vallitalea sediminicola]
MIKVYMIGDCSSIASIMTIEDTWRWYNEEYGTDYDIGDIEECDLQKEGQYVPINELLGKILDLLRFNRFDNHKMFRHLLKREGYWHRYVPYKKALRKMKISQKDCPVEIATTEW